jgi:hypothetical protein
MWISPLGSRRLCKSDSGIEHPSNVADARRVCPIKAGGGLRTRPDETAWNWRIRACDRQLRSSHRCEKDQLARLSHRTCRPFTSLRGDLRVVTLLQESAKRPGTTDMFRGSPVPAMRRHLMRGCFQSDGVPAGFESGLSSVHTWKHARHLKTSGLSPRLSRTATGRWHFGQTSPVS